MRAGIGRTNEEGRGTERTMSNSYMCSKPFLAYMEAFKAAVQHALATGHGATAHLQAPVLEAAAGVRHEVLQRAAAQAFLQHSAICEQLGRPAMNQDECHEAVCDFMQALLAQRKRARTTARVQAPRGG